MTARQIIIRLIDEKQITGEEACILIDALKTEDTKAIPYTYYPVMNAPVYNPTTKSINWWEEPKCSGEVNVTCK